jgi:hypothetical protein
MKAYLLFLVFLFCSCACFGQLAYEYPVKPGTEEWKAIDSQLVKDSLCQIPDDIINRLTTEELLDVCLEYPMLGDILAFNNVQDGIEGVKNNFNGIYELLLRTNCSQVLIDRYVNTSPKDFQESWSLFKKGDYSFKIMVLELLIAQPEITSRLNVEQKKTLISNLIEKKVDKSNPEIYGRTSHMTVYFTISKVLISDAIYYELTKDLMDDVVKLSTSGNLKATSLVPQIHQLAIAYINDNSL